jgi:hypothetical protein
MIREKRNTNLLDEIKAICSHLVFSNLLGFFFVNDSNLVRKYTQRHNTLITFDKKEEKR